MDDGLDIPSFTQQTKFPAGVFSFGLQEKKGLDYFNPGLVRRPDGLWLITRRSKWQAGLRFGMNDIVAFLLDGRNPSRMAQIQHHRRWSDEQYEDPRSIYHNGRTWVGCCDFVWTASGWTGAHQIICEISNDWQQVQRYDPIYGNNGDNLGKNSGHEKNWIWFFHNDLPHLIYSAQPHTICQFTNDFVFQEEFITKTLFPWEHGIVRGGTPPVKVGDEYWTFFHSSTIWRAPKRRYHMGAYAFESKPPFRITQMTHVPILSGSHHDRWAESKPLVIFPCGSEYQDGKWLVTMGINDLNAGWIEIPHTDIMERCAVKKSFSLGRWASELITGKVGVIAYLPPPGIGHTEVFLKNLKEHPPASPVHLLSDHTWPGAKSIPAPPIGSKDKIACHVFLHALELAEKQELDKFIYLETDCRVAGEGWDKELFKLFPNGTFDAIAGGNLAITGYDRAERDFKALVEKLVKKHGYERCTSVADRTKIIFQGELTDKPVAFVNGAPAVYSTKAVREVLGAGSIESIVAKMTSSDHSIGELAGDPTTTLKRYVHIPQVMATAGETIYPFHIRRNSLQSGDCVAVHPIKNRWRPPPENGASFYHCGDLGDILYGLKAIKLYGGGKLVLGTKCVSKKPPRQGQTKESFAMWEPLLRQQDYLTDVQFSEHCYDATHDLNEFRPLWVDQVDLKIELPSHTLCEAHCYYIGVEPLFNTDPWIVAEKKPISRIMVHRSFRYNEQDFPWAQLVDKYRNDMCFTGLPDEYAAFVEQFGKIPYYQPLTFADMAAVINGAEWAICNQSFPAAIAIGLGKNIVLEQWDSSPDCNLIRNNFYTQDTIGLRKEPL